ncbi:MAG TPA: FtsW/RodA/SpoVE family cell cycle protein [Acidimicrobiales bacterium]|nr:FtsW/RodA/SpoVE family cell cycle protein [Acidimicrobiales bacterium]
MIGIAPSSPRRTELGLIVLAVLVTTGAYVLASLGKTASLPANVGPFLIVIVGLLAVAHIALRRLAPAADGVLLPVAGLLNGIGYVFIARLNKDLAGLQAMWTAVGVAAFIATLAIVRRPRDLERYRYTFALIGVGLLLMPLAPGIGRTVNGARLWVRVGPMTFQPGELAKIVLAIFFASYLVEKRALLSRKNLPEGARSMLARARYFGPILLAWGASLVVLVAEKDLGSSLLFFGLFVTMLWVATGWVLYLAAGAGLFGVGAAMSFAAFAHVKERIDVWIDPWSRQSTQGFQILQALFGMGTGGLAGTGLGLGDPQRIPAAETDLIFAAIGEELGLLGTVAILVAFLTTVGVGLRIAVRARSEFEQLLAVGLTTVIGLQAFLIIGGVTRLLPLTGVTLPFVSYGGSSLVANYILLALLLRISDSSAKATA